MTDPTEVIAEVLTAAGVETAEVLTAELVRQIDAATAAGVDPADLVMGLRCELQRLAGMTEAQVEAIAANLKARADGVGGLPVPLCPDLGYGLLGRRGRG